MSAAMETSIHRLEPRAAPLAVAARRERREERPPFDPAEGEQRPADPPSAEPAPRERLVAPRAEDEAGARLDLQA